MGILVWMVTNHRIVCLLLVFSLSGCGLFQSGGESGYVFDSTDGKPLKDVYVVAKWSGDHNIWHPASTCIHMVLTKTNSEGYYKIPAQIWDVGFTIALNIRREILVVYKPGFRHDFQSKASESLEILKGIKIRYKEKNDTHYLKPYSSENNERIASLNAGVRFCGDGKMEGDFDGYFVDLRRKALKLAKDGRQRREAWNIQFSWELRKLNKNFEPSNGLYVRQSQERRNYIDVEMRKNAFKNEQHLEDFSELDYFDLQ